MSISTRYDAVVVGGGPNGLAAAVALAQQGCSVLLVEGKETIGGGLRSEQLTLPGFTHDVCATIVPLAAASPFLRTLPLEQFGLEWVNSPVVSAHPLDDGTAVLAQRSIEETAESLGSDGRRYARLMRPIVDHADAVIEDILAPIRRPHHLLTTGPFLALAGQPASLMGRLWFRGDRARALFAGMVAHSVLPFNQLGTSAFGFMMLMLAHSHGWPLVCGGSQQLADALAAYFRSLGGEIWLNCPIERMEDLPPARAYLFDVGPHALSAIAGDQLPPRFRRRLDHYRYGPGVFKLDLALDGPVPWASPDAAKAATVHLGGRFEEIAAAEHSVWNGRHPERPFVLLAQQSLFDTTRAPSGQHTVWAYCHVPNGSTTDMTDPIERQIERFAPGFRDRILARHTRTAVEYAQYNPNNIGGDIVGGVHDVVQLIARPTWRWSPYTTPAPDIFLCSASTPPGGGVHGLSGYYAARAALRHIRSNVN